MQLRNWARHCCFTSARNVDFYREQLRKRSNRIYDDLHLHGISESMVGREVAMIGFGRIGRALVDLMRGFDLQWLVYDPYVPKSLAETVPCSLRRIDDAAAAALTCWC